MPLCSDLHNCLFLASNTKVTILWPTNYSWNLAHLRLDAIKSELSRSELVTLKYYDSEDFGFDWHKKGGFPVPKEKLHLVGGAGQPKDSNDIRGEIFEVHRDNESIRVAYDYSDYSIISTDILKQVDLYAKCAPPPGKLPSKVVGVGVCAKDYELLAKARQRVLANPVKKSIDVYGRFGSWTDSQTMRKTIVEKLAASSLRFTGGFGVRNYISYLRELMRSKIAIELPGQGGWSYRLVEAMALGAVVVAPEPTVGFPEKLIDGIHYVAIRRDGSNVVEICKELLDNETRRQSIATQAHLFFDRNFSPQSKMRRMFWNIRSDEL